MGATKQQSDLAVVVTKVVKALMALHQEKQADLAEVLGLGIGAVHDRMTGKTRWSLDDLAAMAEHWQVRAMDFLRDPQALLEQPMRRRPRRQNPPWEGTRLIDLDIESARRLGPLPEEPEE